MTSEKPQPGKTWGMSAVEFYTALKDKPIQITTLDGKVYRGTLIGVDQYEVFVATPQGILLMAKHAIKFAQGETTAPQGT